MLGQFQPLLFNEEGRLRAGYRVAIFFILWGYGPAAVHWVVEGTLLRSMNADWLWAESIFLNLLRLVVILLAGWWTARVIDRRPFVDYGFRLSARWWIDFVFGLLLGAVLLIFPLGLVPFSNTLPAWAMLLLAAGLVQRDGVLILLGYLFLLGTIVYFAALGIGVLTGAGWVVNLFNR